MEADQPTRVWVDDPNAIFRRGLANCLAGAGFEVVGESSGLVPEPDLRHTDVLLLDVEDEGWRRGALLARSTRVRVVGLARTAREEALFDAVEAGLAGFLIRSETTPESLVSCLANVAGGNGSLPRELLARLFDGLAKGATRGSSAGRLARRELDVLRLLAEGGDTRDIAGALCYSESTVKNIVHDVLVKMNCRTRAHAVALATRQGFI